MARKAKAAPAPAPEPTPTPAHSPLGASGAHRWMECPGSVALIQALGPINEEEPDYQREGTLAHSFAAHCLEHDQDGWEALAHFPDATADMSDAVQVYVDHVRAQPGRRYVELRVEHSAFHEAMFSQLDAAILNPDAIVGLDISAEIVDYKHGVGVVVEVDDNPQVKYYGFAFLNGADWPDDLPRLSDDAFVRLTIAQPRVTWHPDGGVRSWVTTAGELRRWAYEELRPAMARAGEATFKMGEHCRFCPAKLVCPLMRKLGFDAALAGNDADLPSTDDEWLGHWYGRIDQLKMFINAVSAEVRRRVLDGRPIATAKIVHGLVDRVWKDDAPLVETFGDKAWKPAELLSPARVEKDLPGGREFVAEYAQKPEPPLTVASITDKRSAVTIGTDAEVFSGVQIPG